MTIITIDLSGDVELIVRRDVAATVFRRVYEDDAGRRLGLGDRPCGGGRRNPGDGPVRRLA
ncbi:hypothetical protein BRD02_12385 [Halobacteriales archaeon QS_8_69_73]|nr:MAG: hypothetical protein BRD02_12385 [Halobacteriales archaeon QS_8_69_73]